MYRWFVEFDLVFNMHFFINILFIHIYTIYFRTHIWIIYILDTLLKQVKLRDMLLMLITGYLIFIVYSHFYFSCVLSCVLLPTWKPLRLYCAQVCFCWKFRKPACVFWGLLLEALRCSVLLMGLVLLTCWLPSSDLWMCLLSQ